MARGKRLLTRGAVIAWVVSLAVGIAWVAGLAALPAELDPVVSLAYSLVGIFGVIIGIGIATGVLVTMLRFLGGRSSNMSPLAQDLAPDRVFGICVILFALPSLLAR